MEESTVSEAHGFCCPVCKRDTEIDVLALVWVRLYPDGTDADDAHAHDHEYDDASLAHCAACGHYSTAAEFKGRRPRVSWLATPVGLSTCTAFSGAFFMYGLSGVLGAPEFVQLYAAGAAFVGVGGGVYFVTRFLGEKA